MSPMNYTEAERGMLLAFVQSPLHRLLEKVIEEDRRECLERMATEKSVEDFRRLQGRVEGCMALKNVPKIIARLEIEKKAAEDAKNKSKKTKA